MNERLNWLKTRGCNLNQRLEICGPQNEFSQTDLRLASTVFKKTKINI